MRLYSIMLITWIQLCFKGIRFRSVVTLRDFWFWLMGICVKNHYGTLNSGIFYSSVSYNESVLPPFAAIDKSFGMIILINI